MKLLLFAAALGGAAAVDPAPTIAIAPNVNLPYVALGTGSGQHGSVANATALWLGSSAGKAIDTSIIYGDQPAIAAGIQQMARDNFRGRRKLGDARCNRHWYP